MSRKTRKLMWSVPLMAAVAIVIGALAAFHHASAPNGAQAQGLGNPRARFMNCHAGSHERPTSIKLTWERA